MKQTSTYLDSLHPAVCFAYFLAAIVFSVVLEHPVYLAMSVLGGVLLNLSLTGPRALKKLLLYLPLAVAVAAINPLFNTLGQTPLFYIFSRPYTWEALVYGMIVGQMLLSVLLWFSAYNRVLTEDKFTYLFGTLSPSLSLLLTTVFRLIPNLTRKLRQILNARKCIGMAGGSGPKQTLRSGVTALSVLTSWALEGGVTTADSMNSRGYGCGRRSCFHSYRFRWRELALTLALAVAAGLALPGMLAPSVYFPGLALASPKALTLAAWSAFLLIPTLLNWKEALIWHSLRSRL